MLERENDSVMSCVVKAQMVIGVVLKVESDRRNDMVFVHDQEDIPYIMD